MLTALMLFQMDLILRHAHIELARNAIQPPNLQHALDQIQMQFNLQKSVESDGQVPFISPCRVFRIFDAIFQYAHIELTNKTLKFWTDMIDAQLYAHTQHNRSSLFTRSRQMESSLPLCWENEEKFQ